MEETAEFLRRLAKVLDEPADYRKIFRIANELSECADNLFGTGVQMFCKQQDELFVKNLRAGKP